MSKTPPQPSSPAEWQEYANSNIVAAIPLQKDQRQDTAHVSIRRDVYLDHSVLSPVPSQLFYVYCDVFAITESEVSISPEDLGQIQIIARVLTAATPVHLKIAAPPNGCQIYLYGSILNQPITVSSPDISGSVTLDLGRDSGNFGALLLIQPNEAPRIKYQKQYIQVVDDDLHASLETQMRIGLALFWTNISVAISLCAYVATVTANPSLYTELNSQAVALGQQLAAQVMTGPDMSYAPVLRIDQYRQTLDATLDAVRAFKEQYERFQDKSESLEEQKAAWNAMLSQAEVQLATNTVLSTVAKAKYHNATDVVGSCKEQLQADYKEIHDAKIAFNEGIAKWERKQHFLALLGIFGALIGFAMDIGELCRGDLSSIADALNGIDDAVSAAEAAEGIESQDGVRISSRTMKALGDSMKALESLYPVVDEHVQAIERSVSDPSADIPSIGDISGSTEGDADANAIMALGAWEDWKLESDQQLEFAVGQGIEGASAYRLALQKHSMNGQTLAQAEAENVKAGNEYIRAMMEVIVNNRDIVELRTLLDEYQGQLDIYAQAEARFYDRYWAIRTSLVIEMRKTIWAYRYWALQDSTIVLDSQKPLEEFVMDIATLDQEVEAAAERYASDFQPFNWTVPSNRLPSNYGALMIEGLKSDRHSASFTLAPSINPDEEPNFASVFIRGSHFRLDGLEPFLRGAVPQPEAIEDGVVQVDIQISTSGVYADINAGRIFNFTSLTRSVRFSYDLTAHGEQGETHVHATFPTEEHAEPTPFTQWTIRILQPEKLDLSGLTGVDLEWTGRARFDIPPQERVLRF